MSAEGRIVDDQGDFIDVFIDTALFPCKVVNGRLTLMGGDRFRSDAQEALGEGLSGMVTGLDGLTAYYGWLQGFCFALPAYLLSYTIGRDPNYLRRLYDCLKRFDDYLWTYRDSDGDGCLESWCVWDTGEDNWSRFFEGSPEKSHL